MRPPPELGKRYSMGLSALEPAGAGGSRLVVAVVVLRVLVAVGFVAAGVDEKPAAVVAGTGHQSWVAGRPVVSPFWVRITW